MFQEQQQEREKVNCWQKTWETKPWSGSSDSFQHSAHAFTALLEQSVEFLCFGFDGRLKVSNYFNGTCCRMSPEWELNFFWGWALILLCRAFVETPWQLANQRLCQCQDCLRGNGISSGNVAASSVAARNAHQACIGTLFYTLNQSLQICVYASGERSGGRCIMHH